MGIREESEHASILMVFAVQGLFANSGKAEVGSG